MLNMEGESVEEEVVVVVVVVVPQFPHRQKQRSISISRGFVNECVVVTLVIITAFSA